MLKVDINETLRYLGMSRSDANEHLVEHINNISSDIIADARPLYTYKIFDTNTNTLKKEIELKNSILNLSGNSIFEHLKTSEKCAVLATTLGISIDNKISLLQSTDMKEVVIYDACASSIIESLCDYVENEIQEKAKQQNYYITQRFSAGYGDLSIDFQKDICKVLDASKTIGLTVSKNNLMIPIKSVTAFIGFSKFQTNKKIKSCDTCNLNATCIYKKEGTRCEY